MSENKNVSKSYMIIKIKKPRQIMGDSTTAGARKRLRKQQKTRTSKDLVLKMSQAGNAMLSSKTIKRWNDGKKTEAQMLKKAEDRAYELAMKDYNNEVRAERRQRKIDNDALKTLGSNLTIPGRRTNFRWENNAQLKGALELGSRFRAVVNCWKDYNFIRSQ
jgi:hypothetical protein